MKIALVAPSPQPYTPGGAENLLLGLFDAIRQQDQHQVELIKIPTPERSFIDLLNGYQTFSQLDLNHFDAIITSKYPAWMVNHPNHLCWMLHKLRGVYDTYPSDWPQHLTPTKQPAALKPLLQLLAAQPQYEALQDSFNLARQTLADHPECFSFPGPLTRQLIHYWDNIAQRPGAIQHHWAISKRVKNRLGYFPPTQQVTVLHPPVSLPLPATAPTAPDTPFIFTASRLDIPKRLDLIISAYQRLDTHVELHLAGSGPQLTQLQALAANNPRIRFLGYLDQTQLAQAYQQAEFIVFTPQDEDYGLIAPEAMQAGKALLTTTDAGGVTELVAHQQTGLIVQPNPAALALGMQWLLDNPQSSHQFGQQAKEHTRHLNWPATLSPLLQALQPTTTPSTTGTSTACTTRRQKLVVVATFPAWPVYGGGQQRLYQIYRHLAKHHNITLVCLGTTTNHLQLAEGFTQYQCAYTPAQHRISGGMDARLNKDLSDIVTSRSAFFNPEFMHTLRTQVHDADRVIACHPYLHSAIRAVWSGPLIYEAQDVEPDVKASLLGNSPAEQQLLQQIAQLEAACLQDSELLLTCSTNDAQRMQYLYPGRVPATLVIPNGVDCQATPYTPWAARQSHRQRHGLKGETLLFMGSLHPPNVEAANHCIQLAAQHPDLELWLVGSVCQSTNLLPPTSNVRCLGLVQEPQRQQLLTLATLALNPMCSGSGTNLKMLEYTAAGIPVISTPFGLRGLNFCAPQHLLLTEISNFRVTLRKYLQLKAEDREALSLAARHQTEQQYDWSTCTQPLTNWLTTP